MLPLRKALIREALKTSKQVISEVYFPWQDQNPEQISLIKVQNQVQPQVSSILSATTARLPDLPAECRFFRK
jgi:hypothetical protein